MANPKDQTHRPAMDEEKRNSGNKDQHNQHKPEKPKTDPLPDKNHNSGRQTGRN